jgi:hypothetical protein
MHEERRLMTKIKCTVKRTAAVDSHATEYGIASSRRPKPTQMTYKLCRKYDFTFIGDVFYYFG